jgi:DNA repair protein RecN (Recombination protein N)
MPQNAGYYVSRAAAFASDLEGAGESINSAAFQLSDAAETLRDFRDSLDFSPEEYDSLETRISLLSKLQRKYNRDEDGLIEHLAACREKLDNIQYADERSAKLQKQLREAEALCRKKAAKLSQARQEAAKRLETRISDELRALSMPSVRFAVELAPLEGDPGFDANGADRVRFLMSANAGEELGRISRIASGGELSRIMLAMKNVFAENDPVPTMIFDEIDTGVSGIAAQRVGEKLYTVSLGKQVMCVTHLPQIAAMADQHYLIRKEERSGRTYTDVMPLDREGRKQELARLHGGDHITATTLASAEEQLTACEGFKAEKCRKTALDRQ